MGHIDNPRRIRKSLVAVSFGALLLASGGYGMYQSNVTIQKQDKVIHEYQLKLDEQGSLIDQQKKDLVNQKQELNELTKQVDNLNQQLGKQKTDNQQAQDTFNQQKDSLEKKIKELEQELAFKKAHEGKAIAASTLPSTPSQGRTVTVEATGYIATCSEGCTGVTATGYNLAANPNAKVIAVDPNVIPLGTKVYVPGYGYAVAADTGGAINGHKIDVHFPSTHDAVQWGRRTINITVYN
jgi:3D (Asp-Asp-Asp) domain-containing protein